MDSFVYHACWGISGFGGFECRSSLGFMTQPKSLQFSNRIIYEVQLRISSIDLPPSLRDIVGMIILLATGLAGSLLVFISEMIIQSKTFTEIGKKAWQFAKPQPGRARKGINAT